MIWSCASSVCTCVRMAYVLVGGVHPSQSSNNASIMHLMKGYHAKPFLKHSGKKKKIKSVLSEGEVESLLSFSDDVVVEGYLATMIQFSVTNHWSPCQKQGHSVPHHSFLLYCVMHHPMKWRLNGYSPYCGEESREYFISFFFLSERSQLSRLHLVSNYILLQLCNKAGSAIIIIILLILLLYFIFYFIFSC